MVGVGGGKDFTRNLISRDHVLSVRFIGGVCRSISSFLCAGVVRNLRKMSRPRKVRN